MIHRLKRPKSVILNRPMGQFVFSLNLKYCLSLVNLVYNCILQREKVVLVGIFELHSNGGITQVDRSPKGRETLGGLKNPEEQQNISLGSTAC